MNNNIDDNKLKIIIDSRETTLYKNILDRDLDKYKDLIIIENKQLDLADIHIIYKSFHFVFERKTVNDLLCSIKDNRYKEQKLRLLSTFNPNNITYIIENDDIISSKNNNNQTLLSSIYLYSIYRDNIKIIFTKNVMDTITYLLIFSIKLLDNPNKFINEYKNDDDLYLKNIKIKSKKIDNIDKNTCFIMQLSQIPYISYVIAKNIADKYQSMRLFIKTLEETDDKIKLLCEIDKIGKNKAEKIIEFLDFEK